MNAARKLVCLDGATLYGAVDQAWEAFAAEGIEIVVYDRTPPGEVAARLAGADYALTNKTPITAATIAACPGLKYIGVLATGYNIVDTSAAAAAGVAITNVPAYSTSSVAQTAIALLLALAQQVETYGRLDSQGRWSACPDFHYRLSSWHELAGKTFGVVGFGNTGRATAAIAAALGMKVAVATSKDAASLPEGYRKTDVDELFATCDVVSLHCPLTPDTASMVDAGRLATMRPGAMLINTARGQLVDEQALAAALTEGRIAGAGLDVLCQEPPQADNPLLSAPHCIVTPHMAWSSAEARQRLTEEAAENFHAFLRGERRNTVAG
jgi:glycerate dehydrogenase